MGGGGAGRRPARARRCGEGRRGLPPLRPAGERRDRRALLPSRVRGADRRGGAGWIHRDRGLRPLLRAARLPPPRRGPRRRAVFPAFARIHPAAPPRDQPRVTDVRRHGQRHGGDAGRAARRPHRRRLHGAGVQPRPRRPLRRRVLRRVGIPGRQGTRADPRSCRPAAALRHARRRGRTRAHAARHRCGVPVGDRRCSRGARRGPDPVLAPGPAAAPGLGVRRLGRRGALGALPVPRRGASGRAGEARRDVDHATRIARGPGTGRRRLGAAEHPLRRHRAGRRIVPTQPPGDGGRTPVRRLQGPGPPPLHHAAEDGHRGRARAGEHVGPRARRRPRPVAPGVRPRDRPGRAGRKAGAGGSHRLVAAGTARGAVPARTTATACSSPRGRPSFPSGRTRAPRPSSRSWSG